MTRHQGSDLPRERSDALALDHCLLAMEDALKAYNATVEKAGRLNWAARQDAQREYEIAVTKAWRDYDEATW